MSHTLAEDDPLVEGETYENVYLIEPHDFIPFPDLVARLTGESIGLQAELNDHTDLVSFGVRTTVLDKELVKIAEREFHYIVTYRVDYVPEDPVHITAGAYGRIMAGIIASIILAVAVSVTLIQVRKTAKETPLALLGLGYVLVRGISAAENRGSSS